MRRAPAEILLGSADEVLRGIESDFALLDAVEDGGAASVHVWTSASAAVVLGVSLDVEREADLEACRERGVAVVRRSSGGGAVVVGPGTLQVAFALPHVISPLLATIEGTKRFCAGLMIEALGRAGCDASLEVDRSGDLRREDRKVAGVALARRRSASLLHATLLVEADLTLLGAVLRHPAREPDYRGGRRHEDFVANLVTLDSALLGPALHSALRTAST